MENHSYRNMFKLFPTKFYSSVIAWIVNLIPFIMTTQTFSNYVHVNLVWNHRNNRRPEIEKDPQRYN